MSRNPDYSRRQAERAALSQGDLESQARVEVSRVRQGLYPVDPEDPYEWVQVSGRPDPWSRPPLEPGAFTSLYGSPTYDSWQISEYGRVSTFHLAQLSGENVTVLEVRFTGWPYWRMQGSPWLSDERIPARVALLSRRPFGLPPVWINPAQPRREPLEGRLEASFPMGCPLMGRLFSCPARELSMANNELMSRLRDFQKLLGFVGALGHPNEAILAFAKASLLERGCLVAKIGSCEESNLGWFFGWSSDVLPAKGYLLREYDEWSRQTDAIHWRRLRVEHLPSREWELFDLACAEDAAYNNMTPTPHHAQWIVVANLGDPD